MSRALLHKELREHGALLVIAASLAWLALEGMLYSRQLNAGRFQVLSTFELSTGTLLAMVLSNRLFAREYAGRTQLFLEILPLSRWRVFATKWLLGCALLLAITGCAWLITLNFQRRTEAIATSDALVTLGSFALYSLTLWSFAVLAGMLGRYRYLAWIMGALGIALVIDVSGITMEELPVLRLLGDDVMMARAELSTSDVWIPLGLAASFTCGATALALHGSGAIASMLAQRMTTREVSFIVISVVAVLTVVSSLESKPVKPKFVLAEGEAVTGRQVSVAVLPTSDFDADASSALATIITNDVDSLLTALQLPAKPSIAIMPQHGLDPYVMQRAALSNSDGIVLRAAPDAPRDTLRALVLHALLGDYTLSRGFKEDRHMLLDGMASYWIVAGDAERRAVWWLRAAAVPLTIDAQRLAHWSQTSEQLGDCLSQSVAFGVMDSLVARIGRERMLQLMRQVFVKPHNDVRVLFERTPETLLARAGVSWQVLAADFESARRVVRSSQAQQLQRRPTITTAFDWRDDRKRGLTLEVQVRGAAAYRVLYGQLAPWAAEMGNLARLDARTEHAVLPISPAHGARVLAVVEVDDAVLGCPTRVLARRVTLP